MNSQLRFDYGSNSLGVHTCAGHVHKNLLSEELHDLRASFGKTSVQQRISKAERNAELLIRIDDSLESLFAYYQLHIDTRRRQGGLAQPWRYFLSLREFLFQTGHGTVILAHLNETPIAGAVLLYAFGTATLKHSASRYDYWALAPNHLVIWSAMQHVRRLGYKWFDWGRTGIRADNLRQFKRGWCPNEEPLTYCETGPQNFARRLTASYIRKGISACTPFLPRCFTRLAGAALYKMFY